MTRNTLRAGLAFFAAGALAGAMSLAVAGGDEHCTMGAKAQTASADKHEHCQLDKNVTKEAKMTDTGAVVTLHGKNEESIKIIKSHLEAHMKGESCPDCPLSMKGVTTKVAMDDKGGSITATGDNPETVKALQKWANGSAGACCMKGKGAEKA